MPFYTQERRTKEITGDRNIRSINLGVEMFRFESENDWTNSAQEKVSQAKQIPDTSNNGIEMVLLDKRGRVCTRGLHFMRAIEENTYPIIAYRL